MYLLSIPDPFTFTGIYGRPLHHPVIFILDSLVTGKLLHSLARRFADMTSKKQSFDVTKYIPTWQDFEYDPLEIA